MWGWGRIPMPVTNHRLDLWRQLNWWFWWSKPWWSKLMTRWQQQMQNHTSYCCKHKLTALYWLVFDAGGCSSSLPNISVSAEAAATELLPDDPGRCRIRSKFSAGGKSELCMFGWEGDYSTHPVMILLLLRVLLFLWTQIMMKVAEALLVCSCDSFGCNANMQFQFFCRSPRSIDCPHRRCNVVAANGDMLTLW